MFRVRLDRTGENRVLPPVPKQPGERNRTMNYFAHTATKPDGTPDPDRSRWQPLATHLRNVAGSAKINAVHSCDWLELCSVWPALGCCGLRW